MPLDHEELEKISTQNDASTTCVVITWRNAGENISMVISYSNFLLYESKLLGVASNMIVSGTAGPI